MKPLITDINQLDMNKSYTYADYLTWRFDEMVEIIKGKIFKMSPAPNTFHQMVSANILTLLKVATKGQKCKTFAAPTDVRLITKGIDNENIKTVVQPDIFIVCDSSKLDERGCIGSPDLIIEILSPSSSSKDLNIKYSLYEEAGVREYWIVHPGDLYVQCYILEDGKYRNSGVYAEYDKVPVHTIPGLELAVEEIFER